MLSMPPTTITSDVPATSASCARIAASIAEPHILFTVVHPVDIGRPAFNAACRAGAWPCPAASTQPKIALSTSAGAMPARSTAALMATAPRSLAASDLGAVAIKAAVERAGIAPADVDKAIFGCVLAAGQGQAPARQAALKAGLPMSTGCTTVNKMCGSAMEAAILAHDALVAGTSDVMVVGGMESMTNAPYLMPKARAGYRMGHQQVLDHMFYDGLEDAYDKGRLMGTFAEDCADKYAFTREEQDSFALASLARALAANNDGTFAWEIAPVTVTGRKGDVVIDRDEQ